MPRPDEREKDEREGREKKRPMARKTAKIRGTLVVTLLHLKRTK